MPEELRFLGMPILRSRKSLSSTSSTRTANCIQSPTFFFLRIRQETLEFQAHWQGHDAWEESWVPLAAMQEDVPVMVEDIF